ncbi:hypothetical protein REPUB_Repub02eG0170300 [Reevesia pubescens]
MDKIITAQNRLAYAKIPNVAATSEAKNLVKVVECKESVGEEKEIKARLAKQNKVSKKSETGSSNRFSILKSELEEAGKVELGKAMEEST